MHDIKAIRDNPEIFDAGWGRRGLEPQAELLTGLYGNWKQVEQRDQERASSRNRLSGEIGARKRAGQPVDDLMAQVDRIKDDGLAARLKQELDDRLAALPNLPHETVPNGGEGEAMLIETHGSKPTKMEWKNHQQLGAVLGMEFERAAKMAGTRFSILSGPLARLERALGQYMLDMHVRDGWTEMQVPYLVNEKTVFGTGQLPKARDDMFATQDGRYLIPTGEVPLTNIAAGEILLESDLPFRLCALTPCFRLEAGAAGRDTAGIMRQHQFNKVELVTICTAEMVDHWHGQMIDQARKILIDLKLPFRLVLLSARDMSFSARKTFDLEVWLPGQDTYREIASISDCGDFQARRMNTRYRPTEGGALRHPYTLNGSALAVGRLLVAVMENYQDQDGTIHIPVPLRPYMGGMEKISR